MTGDRPVIVVMGVSAAGKSTVAAALAEASGAAFVDADDLHPEANRAKMRSGVPLDDDDRWPWLDAVGRVLAEHAEDRGAVVACSALRRPYRERLLAAAPTAVFVHLDAAAEVLAARAAARTGHFMPAGLLDSQLATLEPLDTDEPGFRVDVAATVDEVVRAALAGMERRANTIAHDG